MQHLFTIIEKYHKIFSFPCYLIRKQWLKRTRLDYINQMGKQAVEIVQSSSMAESQPEQENNK